MNVLPAARFYSLILIMAAIMTLTPSPALGKDSDTEVQNKAVVTQAFAAWAKGTGGPYDLLAEKVSWTITGNSIASRTYSSREDFMSHVIRPFNARMKVGLRPTIRSIHADGDRVIVFFDAQGTATDGKPYVNTYAWFLDLDQGRIVQAHAFFDSIAFDDLWTRVKVE